MPPPAQSMLRQILAKNVRNERMRRRMSQTALGELAGLTQKTISHIESCTDATTIDSMERIAAALQIRPATLFKED